MRQLSLCLAGDALITRPWSHNQGPAFLELIEEIRSADVSIANLETVIHEFKGHAQADCGGTYMASPPEIAMELRWAGFNMLAHANNHSFDYGSSGVIETNTHVREAGMILAGSGADLQSARSARLFGNNGATVALVATSADFIRYGGASHSRMDLPGRPGVNFLRVSPRRIIQWRPIFAITRLRAASGALRRMGFLTEDSISLAFSISWGRRADIDDLKANLDAISEAASNSSIVVASVHAHRQGQWLTAYAHQAIDSGAHVVFVHGPHQIRGIEVYRERPVFYSLGDFVFEPEYVARFPAEAYERLGLPIDAPIETAKALRHELTSGLSRDRSVYEGMIAKIFFIGNRIQRIHLLPIDLQFEGEEDMRGRPQLAFPKLGKKIIKTVGARSRKFGTRISYSVKENRGEVVLG